MPEKENAIGGEPMASGANDNRDRSGIVMNSIAQPNKISNSESPDTPHSRIEVLDIRPAHIGSVRAFARIKVGAFTISSVKVIQQDGQRPWVKLPDQQGKDGRWFPVVTCSSPTLESAISEAVLAAWQGLQP